MRRTVGLEHMFIDTLDSVLIDCESSIDIQCICVEICEGYYTHMYLGTAGTKQEAVGDVQS